MKHQISENQWEEITVDQKNYWQLKINSDHLPYISELIEFLGDDLTIEIGKFGCCIKYNKFLPPNQDKELVDLLWETVKYKIK